VNSLLDKIDVCIVILTLNEEGSIQGVIRNFSNTLPDMSTKIIVIDGKSSDNTVEIARDAGVEVLIQKTMGKGAAIREAIEYTNADIVVFIDGDGTYTSEEVENLVTPIVNGEADMVIGSRFLGKMENGSITLLNKFGNRLFNFLIKISNKFKITDVLSGYRAIKRECLDEIVLFSVGFEIEVEMTMEFLSKKYRLIEVPISYQKRIDSKTKLRPFHDGFGIFRTLFYAIMNTRPLFFFSILSIILFIIGIYPTSLVLYEKIFLGEVYHLPSAILSSLFFISGGIILVLGILADLIVSTRKRMEYVFKKLMK
jgi:dolichol-phosphate mannosyltransferase